MTSDEAKILDYIASMEKDLPSWYAETIPYSPIKPDLWRQMHDLCEAAKITYTEKSTLFIENLIRLRILHFVTGVSDSKYIPEGGNNNGSWGPSVTIEEYEAIELTTFGRSFLDACVLDNPFDCSDPDKKTVTK